MKQLRPGSNLWFAIWRDGKDGWRYKIEQRGTSPKQWEGVSYEGRETAELAMQERIKGIEGMKQ